MSEDMRGLFFVVKGQYKRNCEPSFKNSVSGDINYIGGYDPYNEDTAEWYMLLDHKTFQCLACGRDFERVVHGVYTAIKKYKGDARRYFNHVHGELGSYPKVSPIMRCMYENVYKEFGDYYSDEVEEMEDLAYSELKEEKPLNKSRKLVSKNKTTHSVEIETPKEEVVIDTKTPVMVKPKVKLGIKKLSMV